ncbi:MAG TPA: PepSY domain-containing protein [Burkholderiales bacterium]|nr:PepSY domain-containing protein [Burkholderiales bacterium]
MTAKSLRAWAWIHKWTSLICTLFMLLLCITGLPLIFHHEIGHLLGTEVEAPEMPDNTPFASLDAVMAAAQGQHPKSYPLFLFRDIDETNMWTVSFGATPDAEQASGFVTVDARSAQILNQPNFNQGFLYVMFKLHVDLFAGLPGTLFLGFMGLLLLTAIVSGVVLYAPFMRKVDFGAVRRDRSPRIKWLDLHNLLGIVTLLWLFVVGFTGVINTLAEPVIGLWRTDQMAEMVAPYKNEPPLTQLASLESSMRAAQAREPAMRVAFVAFPGTDFSSPHHYAVFMRGTQPLTARLLKPVLVDAKTAQVTDSRDMPWYVTALLVSQPLHFGDYGGMPLQVLWAGLDIISIVVLWSGLVLWWRRRKQPLEVMVREADAELDSLVTARQAL